MKNYFINSENNERKKIKTPPCHHHKLVRIGKHFFLSIFVFFSFEIFGQNNAIFNGGISDGFSVSCYTQANAAPLPIELLFFHARLTTEDQVLCTWSTASEINNDYFNVERTVDGIIFEFVAQVDGAGNSSQTLNYSVVDPSPHQGTSYYRLKQVDFNGQYSYSQFDVINLSSIEIITIYPNPSSEYFEYMIGNEQEGMLEIEVIDVLGRIVFSSREMFDKGMTKRKLDVSTLSSGPYLLRIINGNLEKTQKQFLVK